MFFKLIKIVSGALFGLLVFNNAVAQSKLVSNNAELKAALAEVHAGDTVKLTKGQWHDVPLLIEAHGTAAKPVVIMAITPGETHLTGNSFIRVGGEHIIISGLKISDGHAASGAVIEFRSANKMLANYCRVTNCLIENYSKPARQETDNWIIFWGQHNRLDHCTIGDKLNAGTTLIVELNDEHSQQNYHLIDSNYFYHHSPLGSNGGETIRIGVSRYSLTSSNTLVTHNLFEKCSGEVEIISVKSCYNKIVQNTFVECEGGLVLRHGNHNLIEGNLFLGNQKPYTGGIRIINPDHTVINNLVIGCVGNEFRSALSIVNGVPNSPLNRYIQVQNVNIKNNSFISCANILFGAGKDNERTLPPRNVVFENNFIYTDSTQLYTNRNDPPGVIFKNNKAAGPKANLSPGFRTASTRTISWNGLRFPYPADGSGADLNKVCFMKPAVVGATYFKPVPLSQPQGKIIRVYPADARKLPAIISGANTGDIISLEKDGTYTLENAITVKKQLTITAPHGATLSCAPKKNLTAFIVIDDGGSLNISNISFNGTADGAESVPVAITTATSGMLNHYRLKVKNCKFYDFSESNYACFRASKNTYADSVSFNDCLFRDMSGMGVDMSAEKDDKGLYSAEYISFYNCAFTNMLSNAINIYRGGNDESTTGPHVVIDHCTFNNVENREQGYVVKLLGVQYARVANCIFYNSGKGGRSLWFEEYRTDNVLVDYCDFFKAGRVQSFYGKLYARHNLKSDPQLLIRNAEFPALAKNSPLVGKASDGKNIGTLKLN